MALTGSSHPPRKTAKKAKAASKPPEERLELVVEEPLMPAWTDLIRVSNLGKKHLLQMAALHTHLQSVARSPRDDDSDDGTSKNAPLSFTPYEMPNVQPSLSEVDFQVRSKTMVHFSPPVDNQGDAASRVQADGIFLFLYEVNLIFLWLAGCVELREQQNNSTASNMAPWRDPNSVRQQGPERFRSFPYHHFFVRVYRHNAVRILTVSFDFSLSLPRWSVCNTRPDQCRPLQPKAHIPRRTAMDDGSLGISSKIHLR